MQEIVQAHHLTKEEIILPFTEISIRLIAIQNSKSEGKVRQDLVEHKTVHGNLHNFFLKVP
jgi:hypothetical protein